MQRFIKRALYFLLFSLAIWCFLGFVGARLSTEPRLVSIGPAHQYFASNYPAQTISIQARDGQTTTAWYFPNQQASTVVILLAGIGGNRLSMVDRAQLYLEKGFGVFLQDLRGTGESDGGLITFGWQERLDLLAAVDFLKSKKIQHIGVHGCSLGAATISYTLPENPPYHFVVMESPYDNIQQALKNRVALVGLPFWLFRPLIWWTEWRIGADSHLLAPEDYVQHYQSPILLVAGDAELKVKKTETEKIFGRMTSPKKTLIFFKGARHEDYLRRDRQEYEAALLPWIEQFVEQEVGGLEGGGLERAEIRE